MTSLSRLALAALAVGAGCTPAVAHAADPRYDADVTVSAVESWTYKQRGYPDTCRRWIRATGDVSGVAHAKGALIFAGGGGYTVGGLSRTAKSALEVKRVIDFKVHEAPTTPPCVPCGPDSELGACAPPPAQQDAADKSTCAKPPVEADGLVRATFALDGTLTVEGSGQRSRELLLDCTSAQLLPPGVPLGTPELVLKTYKFPGAARRIERLKPGASTTFRKATKDGSGCKSSKAELRPCTTFTTIMKVTRRKD